MKALRMLRRWLRMSYVRSTMTIDPFVGFGPIKFGMTPAEVRHALSIPHSSFMKTPMSQFPTDAFDSIGVHVGYDKAGMCEAIEVFDPGQAMHNGVNLVGSRYADVQASFLLLDREMKIDETGFSSIGTGVSVYAPDKDEDGDARCASVLIFREGYWS